jgi:hypothetical protein
MDYCTDEAERAQELLRFSNVVLVPPDAVGAARTTICDERSGAPRGAALRKPEPRRNRLIDADEMNGLWGFVMFWCDHPEPPWARC